ncbi:hypothetical protein L1281_002254 [Neisseria sp. HSC-16F19]|nr:hypothetical protein [Neisseria sp. HSC-16F19]MCP2041644.1 hypothetical protein [Neisseria sp. HSC-16F19]
MKITNIKFKAENIQFYIEDEVCVVAFADSQDPDPEQYLILSQTLFDSEPDNPEENIEIGIETRQTSTFGKIEFINLESNEIVLDAIDSEAMKFHVAIQFTKAPQGLKDHLKILLFRSPEIAARLK